MEARESGFRQGVALHEGRLFRNGGEAPSQGLATKPEAGRERIITLLSPSAHHTRRTGPGGEGSARGEVALLELELAGRVEYLADRIALCASANET